MRQMKVSFQRRLVSQSVGRSDRSSYRFIGGAGACVKRVVGGVMEVPVERACFEFYTHMLTTRTAPSPHVHVDSF